MKGCPSETKEMKGGDPMAKDDFPSLAPKVNLVNLSLTQGNVEAVKALLQHAKTGDGLELTIGHKVVE